MVSELVTTNQTALSSMKKIIVAEDNPVIVFLSRQMPSSRPVYFGALKCITNLLGCSDPFDCQWWELRFAHTQAIRTALTQIINKRNGKKLSARTINHKLTVLKGLLRTTWQLGLMTSEDYYRAVDIQSVKGEFLPAGRELSSDEISKLIEVCISEPTIMGVRDAALIATLYSCGLRRTEITLLDVDDYDPVSGKLKILGKRNKERTVYIANETAILMDEWLTIRGDEDGPIFIPLRYNIMEFKHITSDTVYAILQKRGLQAGISTFTPHDLRRTFVSDLLEAGADIATVSKLAGHKEISTTMRYDRRPEETKRDATRLLHIKFQRT
jgi:site-specific recombinase XerD